MNLKQLLISFGVLFITCAAFGQNKYTISGYIKDEASGESMIGTNVYIKELMKGTTTNQYGFYSMTLEEGKYTIVVSFVGYTDVLQEVDLTEDFKFSTALPSKAYTTKVVEITAERSDKNVQSTEMGQVKMSVEKIKTLPALLGEVDIIKTLQLLPGIQSGGEGNSGFYVRGGGPDQNLILLDEAVVYNASHLLGFFSVFNADAIKDINIIKGAQPAQYGGRLSSVLDISMKDGNMKEIEVDGGVGLISSRLTIQGPLKKDTSSFILSGRRTYFDILASPFIKDSSDAKGFKLNFYDLNAKINYKISDKDRLFLSGYFGRDNWKFKSLGTDFSIHIPWGNATGVLRWNHLFNNKLFLNTSAIFSDYNSAVSIAIDDYEFKLYSGIRDWNLKMDFNYFPNILHNIKFGTNYIFHTFTPSNFTAKAGDVEFDTGEEKKLFAHEAAAYVSDDFDLTTKLRITAGFRMSMFQQVGPFERYSKDELGNITDTTKYSQAENVVTHFGPEPRIAMRYVFNSSTSIKASASQNYQYIHLTSISASSLPTDFWYPSTEVVKPMVGQQLSGGIFKNLFDNKFETSVEAYYKEMQNLIEYKEGAQPEDDLKNNGDDNFTFGDGNSYGVELFLKKRYGKVNGWIGYTWSKTMRDFPNINGGTPYFAKFDRRHDLSVVGIFEISERTTFSSTFVYATGQAVTLPNGRFVIEQNILPQYGDRNSFRMAPYHRLDIALTINSKPEKKHESSWVFSVYNVYNRKNPYFIYFATSGELSNNNLKISAKQVSLFPILPSIAWNFNF